MRPRVRFCCPDGVFDGHGHEEGRRALKGDCSKLTLVRSKRNLLVPDEMFAVAPLDGKIERLALGVGRKAHRRGKPELELSDEEPIDVTELFGHGRASGCHVRGKSVVRPNVEAQRTPKAVRCSDQLAVTRQPAKPVLWKLTIPSDGMNENTVVGFSVVEREGEIADKTSSRSPGCRLTVQRESSRALCSSLNL